MILGVFPTRTKCYIRTPLPSTEFHCLNVVLLNTNYFLLSLPVLFSIAS